ncbi:MAG: polar amino acid transport system permease protein [Caballeronia sp.]|nr:polar amino acid transport system permease protein [Caballeronia sp.]
MGSGGLACFLPLADLAENSRVYAIITMGTALSSLVGIRDLLDTAQIASSTVARSSFTVLTYVATLVIFFVYCYPISWLTRTFEKRLRTA